MSGNFTDTFCQNTDKFSLNTPLNMCIAIVFLPGCDVINFEINPTYVIKLYFLYDQKSKTKI